MSDNTSETPSGESPTEETVEATSPRRPSPSSRARRIGGRPTPRPAADTAAADMAAVASPDKPDTERVAPAPVRPAPTESTPGSAVPEPTEQKPARRAVSVRWLAADVLGLAVVILIVLLAIASHGVYWAKADTSASSRTASQEQVLAAAKKCFAQINSYDYRHLDGLVSKDLACSTGTFTSDLRRSLKTLILPLAPKNKASQSAQVNRAGIASVSPSGNQVVILIYGQLAQSNSTTASSSPRIDVVGAVVTVDKVKDEWLIAKIDTDVGNSLGS